MIYIIHNRLIWIFHNERGPSLYWPEMFFPSIRNEHKWPPMVIRL